SSKRPQGPPSCSREAARVLMQVASNEKEISHGRVSWQPHQIYIRMDCWFHRLVPLWFHPVTEHSEKYRPKLLDYSVKARPTPRKARAQPQRPRSRWP